jgi:threonine dehydratase
MPAAYADSFRNVPPETWAAFARRLFREDREGLHLRYDPRLREAVAPAFAPGAVAPDLWPLFDAFAGLPLGLIRGANSNLLSVETADEMRRRRPTWSMARCPSGPRALPRRAGGAGGDFRGSGEGVMSNIEMIEAAAARAEGVVRRTPLLSSPFLDEIAGRPVHVKCEALQHTGSFKFRGGWSALSALPEDVRARGVLAFSSGNHAQGVARAAELHGVPATIIMPQDAPRLKIENTRAMGAEVVLYDRAGGEDRNEIGARFRDERGLTLIKPFDEPQVIAGQGTCGLEIAEQAAEIGITEATVLTCCGGGGLTSGIALALEAKAPGMRVRPVEPEGFDDTARSLASGGIVRNEGPEAGFCDAILTPAPGEMTFAVMQRLCGPGIVVTEETGARGDAPCVRAAEGRGGARRRRGAGRRAVPRGRAGGRAGDRHDLGRERGPGGFRRGAGGGLRRHSAGVASAARARPAPM